MHLCTLPANYAMIGVHKSIPVMGYCAHQPIVLWAVCTKALRGYAVVHIARQLCDGQCAQQCTLPADRTMSSVHKGAQGIGCCAHCQKLCNDQCAQTYSSNGLLCTPLIAPLAGSVHKVIPAMSYCAHHLPIVY